MNMDAGASSSSSTTPTKKYDVFISFRGEDTRNNFTSHLYAALCRKQIKAYTDENDLKRGDEISPALLRAIQESKLCLIVLSKNYASSTWCLDELAYILKCKRKQSQEILPIFYKVDPSHVRKQKESYATAFVELEERFKDKMDKVQAWRDALKEVGSLSGWASSHNRCESKLVEVVVEEIIKKLNHTASSSNNLKGLVGIDKHINQIGSLLCIGSLDVRIIGIWGMGGIGKTTLACAVFNQFSSQFDACSFLANVRGESEKHGLPQLEEKLFSELLEEENLNAVRRPYAKGRLRSKKVLIVFDDVNDEEQLEQLVGDGFGLESRIIVTSRDKQVLRNIEDHGIYKLEGLCHYEAHKLFCLHAFKRNSPTKNEIELSRRVVDYAGGIPLALKVLGCHLYSKSIIEWESALDKLQKFPNKKIYNVLRISFDALDDTQKDIFLDIACIFKGENKDLVENILNGCGLYATIGIKDLIDKSLITLDLSNKLRMHDLLQHMGFEIVRVQSSEKPGKGSRLWRADDIFHAMKYNTGLEAIEGISLNTTNVTEEFHLSPTTFSKMYRLRLLIIINGRKVSLPQGPLPFPDKLTYLRWDGYPLQSLSTNFTAKNLVELDMRCSKLEKLWDGIVPLENLKAINLSGSRGLIQVPDLSQARNIERINLELCDRLVEVPSSFQQLDKLVELKFTGCSSLCNISSLPNKLRRLNVYTPAFFKRRHRPFRCDCSPDQTKEEVSFYFPRSHPLHRFEICSKFEKFPEILEPMESLVILELDYTAIRELPQSIEHLKGLRLLSVGFCPNLECLPNTIHKLNSLKKIIVCNCRNLKSLPGLPQSLSHLYAYGCRSLETLSSSSRTLLNLNWDDLYDSWCDHYERSFFMARFSFVDCEKLNENALKILMDEAEFRIYSFAMLYAKYESEIEAGHHITYKFRRFRFCWAGSEIPRWIIHQSEGSSICINLPPQSHNRTYLGLAICLVFEVVGEHNSIPYCFDYECLYESPNGDSLSWKGFSMTCGNYWRSSYNICQDCGPKLSGEANTIDYGEVSCEHVALHYDSTAFLNANKGKYGTNENRFTSTTATLSLSFWPKKEFVKVKKCGVHLMYAQEAEKFGFVQPCDWAERQSNIMLRYKKPDGEEAIGIDSGTQSEPSEEEVSDIDSGTEEPLPKRIRAAQNDRDIDSGTEEPLPKRIRAAQND